MQGSQPKVYRGTKCRGTTASETQWQSENQEMLLSSKAGPSLENPILQKQAGPNHSYLEPTERKGLHVQAHVPVFLRTGWLRAMRSLSQQQSCEHEQRLCVIDTDTSLPHKICIIYIHTNNYSCRGFDGYPLPRCGAASIPSKTRFPSQWGRESEFGREFWAKFLAQLLELTSRISSNAEFIAFFHLGVPPPD